MDLAYAMLDLLIREHQIAGEQKLETSNIFNREVIEEANKSCAQSNKKSKSPFEKNVLKYLNLFPRSPVLLK